jgi:hypothetical protein
VIAIDLGLFVNNPAYEIVGSLAILFDGTSVYDRLMWEQKHFTSCKNEYERVQREMSFSFPASLFLLSKFAARLEVKNMTFLKLFSQNIDMALDVK